MQEYLYLYINLRNKKSIETNIVKNNIKKLIFNGIEEHRIGVLKPFSTTDEEFKEIQKKFKILKNRYTEEYKQQTNKKNKDSNKKKSISPKK